MEKRIKNNVAEERSWVPQAVCLGAKLSPTEPPFELERLRSNKTKQNNTVPNGTGNIQYPTALETHSTQRHWGKRMIIRKRTRGARAIEKNLSSGRALATP